MKSYCIYTDEFCEKEEMNFEHIFPLGLGGHDLLGIRVHGKANNDLGSKIDGRLMKDYLISSLRRRSNFKGHSKKEPETILKSVRRKEDDKLLQITFKPSGNQVFDVLERKYLSEDECVGMKYEFTIKWDKDIRALFVAKTALSAGYYIYGKTFVDFADHKGLRKFMNYSIHQDVDLIGGETVRILDPFKEHPEKEQRIMNYFEALLSLINCTAVMFIKCERYFLVSVSVAGKYLGTINFQADTTKFPNEGKFAGGHIVGVQNNELKRSSFEYMESRADRIARKSG